MNNAQLCFLIGRTVEPAVSGNKPHKTIRIAKRPEYNPTEFHEYALIVRCRDCKNWSIDTCQLFPTVDEPDGFCAWGERKVVD